MTAGTTDPVAQTDWSDRAAKLVFPEGMFVGGEERPALSASVRPVTSARDGSTLVQLAWAQPDDVDAAVAAARRAFDTGPWPRLHPRERGGVLQRFASLVEENRAEIALLVSLEMGKPIRHSYEIELRALIRCLRYYAIFFNSGEMCTAGSRLVVHADVAERVVERIVATSSQWYPADPLLPHTRMGPLVGGRSLTRVLAHLDRGLQRARLRIGGRQVLQETGGAYLEPTVVTDAAPDNPIVRDEIFGPVLAVQVVDSEADAVRVANDTPYGLAAAVWTADLGAAHRVSRALRAGTVWVNCYEEGDMAVPFGGVKLSGTGRDKSRHAMEEYTDLKTTWINYG